MVQRDLVDSYCVGLQVLLKNDLAPFSKNKNGAMEFDVFDEIEIDELKMKLMPRRRDDALQQLRKVLFSFRSFSFF